jgi:hypothetical protein
VLWHFAPEFAPWELDDSPFAERTGLMEQARRDHEAGLDYEARRKWGRFDHLKSRFDQHLKK